MIRDAPIRGYYYCCHCSQMRLSGWTEDGKCTRCGNPVMFIEDKSENPNLKSAYNSELIDELKRRGTTVKIY